MELAVRLTLHSLSYSAERMPTGHRTAAVGVKEERKEEWKEVSKKQTDTRYLAEIKSL